VRGGRFLLGGRRAFEVQGDGGREHLNVADLLRARLNEQVAVLHGAARAERLEEGLEAHADLALDAADGLLWQAGEAGVGRLHGHGVLEVAVVGEHSVSGRGV